MMVHIWIRRAGRATPALECRPIEDLATIVHPMAAVAWDRDCADVELWSADDSIERAPLRFGECHERGRSQYEAYTGHHSLVIAVWSDDEER